MWFGQEKIIEIILSLVHAKKFVTHFGLCDRLLLWVLVIIVMFPFIVSDQSREERASLEKFGQEFVSTSMASCIYP